MKRLGQFKMLLSPDERRMLETLSEGAGLSMSDYLRVLIRNKFAEHYLRVLIRNKFAELPKGKKS